MAARSPRAKDAEIGSFLNTGMSSASGGTHAHATAEASPDRVTWALFWKAALLVIIIWAASALLLYWSVEDFSKSGTFGDSFGVLNTLFSGLAFAGIIVSIKMQNDEMREQRKELQKQKKAAQLYHRERMFLLLMDEFKKSREHRFSIADVRLVVRECLCDVTTMNARSAEAGAALAREVEDVLAGTQGETPLLQVFGRRVFRHERCEVFIKTFRQAAESARKIDPSNKTEYYDIVCNSMSDAEEALLFMCAVARDGAQVLIDPQVMKLRESYDEIRAKL
ncbi:MAG TPA: hypothetical protein VEZ52_12090 [Desulfovibrio sp.]|uniref:hypothetical protein n=1 Tax=Desulfovibrio sp. TaxID=885 RepID=UPI002D2F1DD9|nr:hypothetical protein [Desulfovibrio sp.]HZF62346.1 hypothetical protein [Desulfovibrio sp.]